MARHHELGTYDKAIKTRQATEEDRRSCVRKKERKRRVIRVIDLCSFPIPNMKLA
jgi:hypothetical protein